MSKRIGVVCQKGADRVKIQPTKCCRPRRQLGAGFAMMTVQSKSVEDA